MNRLHWHIALSYGAFLGWLLSFPYNGPVFKVLSSARDLHGAPFSLTYTLIPALFLIGFSVYPAREKYARKIMIASVLTCLTGTLLIFVTDTFWWYAILGVMGVCSVLYIISWSAFYTRGIPVQRKMQVMALVIITGNIFYYLLNLFLPYLPLNMALVLLLGVLLFCLWVSLQIQVPEPIKIPLEKEPFPSRLILIICIFLFVLKMNGGLTFYAIYPSFAEVFGRLATYYGLLPYIATLLLLYFWGHRISKMLPVYLGASMLGLACLSFAALGKITAGYFVTETMLQAGWALLHLFWWTLFGEIASIYGRPVKICSLAFIANLMAVFCGGVMAVYALSQAENILVISAGYAAFNIFIAFLLVPLLAERIEKDLLVILHKRDAKTAFELPQIIELHWAKDILTPREMEVARLLVMGYLNKDIAQRLNISENTLKSHARNIYNKLSVANKRELLQLAYDKEA